MHSHAADSRELGSPAGRGAVKILRRLRPLLKFVSGRQVRHRLWTPYQNVSINLNNTISGMYSQIDAHGVGQGGKNVHATHQMPSTSRQDLTLLGSETPTFRADSVQPSVGFPRPVSDALPNLTQAIAKDLGIGMMKGGRLAATRLFMPKRFRCGEWTFDKMAF